MLKITFLCAFFCLFFVTRIDGIRVTILHYNDLQGQLTPFKTGSDPPKECMEAEGDTCSGGLARIAHVLKEEFDPTNTIRIQTGNFVGSYWMSTLAESWTRFGEFMNPLEFGLNTSTALVPDIITLGMKEFDAGITRTQTYMSTISSKILLTNVNCSAEADFCGHRDTFRYVELGSPDYRVPFVGFMNPRVEQLSEPGNLKFSDIVTALKAEISLNFGSEKHVVAVGQGSLSIAKEIIDQIPRVKIVVFSGGLGDLEEYLFKYNDAVIVKAPKYGGSIGKLTFDYDVNGKISNFGGNKIPIDTKTTPSDKVVSDTINKMYNDAILPLVNTEIGKTAVELQWNRDCWKKECNLGNLVTDAMVRCAYNLTETDPTKLPFGIMSFWHSGAIHDDISHFQVALTALDPHIWFPYHNLPVHVKITGKQLWTIFERSATGLGSQANPDWGQFLQVSKEIRVSYRQTDDNRFVLDDLRAFGKENEDSKVPTYYSVKDHPDKPFEAIIPSFIFNGRSVYNDIFSPGDKINIQNVFDDECVESYIRAEHILRNGFEERIFIGDRSSTSNKCKGSNTAVTVTLTLLIFIFICGIGFLGFRYGYQGWWARRNHQQF